MNDLDRSLRLIRPGERPPGGSVADGPEYVVVGQFAGPLDLTAAPTLLGAVRALRRRGIRAWCFLDSSEPFPGSALIVVGKHDKAQGEIAFIAYMERIRKRPARDDSGLLFLF